MSALDWIRDKGEKFRTGQERANERLSHGMDDKTLLSNCRGGASSFERMGEVGTYRQEAVRRGLIKNRNRDED